MSQETRWRLAARRRLAPAPRTEAEVPAHLRLRRYSEGAERRPEGLSVMRLGRYSDGAEQLPADAGGKRLIGSFSRGHEQLADDAAGKARVGSYAFTRPNGDAR